MGGKIQALLGLASGGLDRVAARRHLRASAAAPEEEAVRDSRCIVDFLYH